MFEEKETTDGFEERGIHERLSTAVANSYRKLETFRHTNRLLVEEYTGPSYGQLKRQDKYLNKLHQAVDAYTMLLAANRPRVMVETRFPQLRPFAHHYGIALNNLIEEIGLEFTIRQWVMDAFFSVGVIKTHLADSGLVEIQPDRWMDPGTPFASNVSLDNMVFDMSASKISEMKFVGDMYRIPFADLKAGVEMGMYDENVAADVTPTSKSTATDDQDRLDAIAAGAETDDDEFEPMVDLADIWIPREGKIYTYIVQNRGAFKIESRPIAEMEWDGPEHGPYHILGFNDVPDNIMPVAPASHLISLDRIINIVMRKQAKRARNQKKNLVYNPAGQHDAKRLRASNDGEQIRVDDTQNISTVEQGGIDGPNQAFLGELLEQFDVMAGNLTALLGLGAQADTAKQEQLIHDAGSKKGSQMQYRVLDATRRLIKDLGFLLWQDEFKVLAAEESVEGHPDIRFDATWRPGDREGNFQDYNIDINVFSMAYQSPTQRAQSLLGMLERVYFPGAEMMMQQGGTIDFKALTNTLAELTNQPRLHDIVKFGPVEMPKDQPAMTLDGPMNTGPREQIRRNIPTGGTPEHRNMVKQQQWMGGGQVNPQQAQSMAHTRA